MKIKMFSLCALIYLFGIGLNAQVDCSLDSILIYNQNNNLSVFKTIVSKKDNEGRKIRQDNYGSAWGLANSATGIRTYEEYYYHLNGELEFRRIVFCFPGHDTCVFRNQVNWNEDGFNTTSRYYTTRLIQDEGDTLILDNLIETWDTTFFGLDGFPSKLLSYAEEDTDPKRLRVEVTYSWDSGLLDTISNYSIDLSGIKRLTSKKYNEYDSEGRIVAETTIGSFGEFQSKMEYDYDTEGREIWRKNTNQDDSYWILLKDFAQDNSNMIETYESYGSGGDLRFSNIAENYFNEFGCLDSLARLSLINSDWLFIEGSKYYYSGTVSTDESDTQYALLLFPNPTSGELNISWESNNLSLNDFRLFDLTGKQVLPISKIHSNQKIQLGHLPKGIYFLKSENIIPQKIIIK